LYTPGTAPSAGGRKPRFDGASRTTISLPMVDIKVSVYLL
jgi:hypothetical protein